MKKLLTVALCALSTAVLAKTVSVDMLDLIRCHPSRERDRSLLRDAEKDYQSQLDAKRDACEDLAKAYEAAIKEARSPALKESARAEAEAKAMKKREALADADQKLREAMRKLQDDLSNLEARLLRQANVDIRKAISDVAKSKNYDVVLDSSTMPYVADSYDITDDVLRKMGVDPKVRKELKAKDAAEETSKK